MRRQEIAAAVGVRNSRSSPSATKQIRDADRVLAIGASKPGVPPSPARPERHRRRLDSQAAAMSLADTVDTPAAEIPAVKSPAADIPGADNPACGAAKSAGSPKNSGERQQHHALAEWAADPAARHRPGQSGSGPRREGTASAQDSSGEDRARAAWETRYPNPRACLRE